jgi:hypothetical protein
MHFTDRQNQLLNHRMEARSLEELAGLAASDPAALNLLLSQQQASASASARAYAGCGSLPMIAFDQEILRQREASNLVSHLQHLRAPGVPGTLSGHLAHGVQQPPMNPYFSLLHSPLARSPYGTYGNFAGELPQVADSNAATASALAAARLQGFQLGSQLGSQQRNQGLYAGLSSSLVQNQNAPFHLGQNPLLSRQGVSQQSGGGKTSLPAVLAQPEDNLKLSSHQVLLRHQISAFEATEDDVSTHTRGRNKPIQLGQIGIRCRHCAHLPLSRRQKGSSYFPATTMGLYQAAQNMSTTHLQCGLCAEMPESIKQEFVRLMSSKLASSGAGRPYWAESAKKLGLVDTEDGGIRLRGSSVV